MQYNKYDDTEVRLLWATPDPLGVVSTALKITMKKDFLDGKPLGAKIIPSVLAMGHTSVFEHVLYSFVILGASRSFLAQITRHRIASYTSGSQHYQVYSDYGSRGHSGVVGDEVYQAAIQHSMGAYDQLIDNGHPPYEARQVLPNAMENNLVFTLNARSLVNFLSLRLCKRNTAEIADVAGKIETLLLDHFPELFGHVGPPCVMLKNTAAASFPELIVGDVDRVPAWAFCNQGHLSACKKRPYGADR